MSSAVPLTSLGRSFSVEHATGVGELVAEGVDEEDESSLVPVGDEGDRDALALGVAAPPDAAAPDVEPPDCELSWMMPWLMRTATMMAVAAHAVKMTPNQIPIDVRAPVSQWS